QASDRRAQPARLPDAARHDGDLHAGGRGRESDDRSGVRLRRSPSEAQVSTPDIAAVRAAPSPLAYFARQTLKAFNTNKTSWIGLLVFLVVVALAIAAPLIAP